MRSASPSIGEAFPYFKAIHNINIAPFIRGRLGAWDTLVLGSIGGGSTQHSEFRLRTQHSILCSSDLRYNSTESTQILGFGERGATIVIRILRSTIIVPTGIV